MKTELTVDCLHIDLTNMWAIDKYGHFFRFEAYDFDSEGMLKIRDTYTVSKNILDHRVDVHYEKDTLGKYEQHYLRLQIEFGTLSIEVKGDKIC